MNTAGYHHDWEDTGPVPIMFWGSLAPPDISISARTVILMITSTFGIPNGRKARPPNEIARRPFGNIAIANADAGANAYTHVAIDEAWRAVGNLNTY